MFNGINQRITNATISRTSTRKDKSQEQISLEFSAKVYFIDYLCCSFICQTDQLPFLYNLFLLLKIFNRLYHSFEHHSSKASVLQCSTFFIVQHSHPYMTTGKTMSLTRRTFVGKASSLLFNMLSSLVIAFLPRSNCLLISWLQSPSAVILEPKKIVSHCFHCFPIYFPWSDGTRSHDLRFLNVEL